jgi:Protein kinase domain
VIHIDDLLAARFLNHQLPDKRDVLMAGLDTLHEATTQRGLLASLVGCNVLTNEQAHYVHQQVERTKRERALAIYAHMLASQGVAGPPLRQCMDQAGPQADMNTLGQIVVGNRLLPPDREQQVRFQARVAFDRDQAQQLQAYLESRGGPGSAAPAVGRETSISGVVRLPHVATGPVVAGMAAPQPGIAQAAEQLGDSAKALQPPQFDVPDWIDTSVPQVGRNVGPYRVLGRIGGGGMGEVYLVDGPEDPTRPVALKVLNVVDRDQLADAQGRFKREILANGFFGHPHMIDAYDAGQTPDGRQYLAMEFFDGQDLAQVLETETQLSPSRAVLVCSQIFEVLTAAHDAGIVHRDVKPENILISRDGTAARLMDFGVAVIRDLGEFEGMVFRTVEGGATGTPEYMSPEQAAGDKCLGPSDLYSMGLVLYQCLSGRLPFFSETSGGYMTQHMLEDPLPLAKASAATKSLPKELHQLLDQLADKDPDKRPSGTRVVKVLQRLLPKLTELERKGSGRKQASSVWSSLWRGRGG